MTKVLILDDEESIVKTLSLHMKNEGYNVIETTDMDRAKILLKEHCPDIVITDLRVGDEDGIDFLKFIKAEVPSSECIIITAYGTIENAVESMKLGAFDYLTKPINSTELKLRVKKAIQKLDLETELAHLRHRLLNREKLNNIVAESDSMKEIVSLIERISDKEVSVLITGETGTGKEVLARLIHDTSTRCNQAFIPINCGALPEDLLDSELFGHVKGAFTGALSDSKGLLLEADKGTVFLDEIGDVPPKLQLRLLRFLQEGEIRPVGSSQIRNIDVRVIAATNKDIKSLIEEGAFREDLYFRLSILPIYIPPLRQRARDIPVFIEHFLDKLRVRYNVADIKVQQSALEKLLLFEWPGNVRQLENTLARAIALSVNGLIDEKCIIFEGVANNDNNKLKTKEPHLAPLDEHVKEYIEKTIEMYSGNQSAAAKALGISRSRLRRQIDLDKK